MPENTLRAHDEAFWQTFVGRYDVDPGGPLNLENGYFGRMSRTVVEEYQRNIEFINRGNSLYVRQHFDREHGEAIRHQVAQLIQASPQTVALATSAVDALQTLIRNYNGLKPGDQVLICDVEYASVKSAMRWLARQRGVEVIEIVHQHPASYERLVGAYRQAFIDHPRLKLMALTYVNHLTGLVMPVQAIAETAREFGVDIILDGAHALGQINFDLKKLGIELAGFNLQKWIGGPLALGFLYIAPHRLADIDPDMDEDSYPASDIRSRTPHSTPNIPALLTLPLVFEEHRALGGASAKGARLCYLRDLWVTAVRDIPGIEVMTPDDRRLYCGITALRFTAHADQQAMADRLLNDYGIFTVVRNTSAGPCIRITPGLITLERDIKRLIAALIDLSRI
ncbi:MULTISPECIES: aminotransferase class V-fold PLP-dependent enzyme [Pseudomonas]|uniref:aminotransferase class V-fold PLP-dependent enzyme n=1 Tax=Pseudomonas TaxID=286 RepID=UPI001BE83858|nr:MULTISPECIES: aminotransferase class V-fold PLP-dependent enzyme [Pseudomonas]MBT2340123.1 aminotransferase class V-fold PLP-dependent enzyme [Pseudomonas fluorescens]MCD4529801.1 aminotransferase class V-fold PLP-dependent enzyme [Pseudomonas sp. C3-2018]